MRKVTLYTLHIRLYSIPSPALFLLGDFQSLLQFMPIILLKGPLILHSLYSLLERRPFFQPRQVGNFVQVSAVRGQHDCRRSPAAVWLWPPTRRRGVLKPLSTLWPPSPTSMLTKTTVMKFLLRIQLVEIQLLTNPPHNRLTPPLSLRCYRTWARP